MPEILKPVPAVKNFCTTREAATLLGVSVGTVQLWAERGVLKAWKTSGGHRRVLRDSVCDLLQQPPEIRASHALVQPSLPVPAREPAPAKPGLRRLSVLVVEDDPVLLHLYGSTLNQWPMSPEVMLAANGLTALLKLGRYSPDLLITELNTAQLDGFEMLRVIRSTPSLDRTTIVVVSELDEAQIKARGGLPRGVEVLCKPVPFAQLLAIACGLANDRRLGLERRVERRLAGDFN